MELSATFGSLVNYFGNNVGTRSSHERNILKDKNKITFLLLNSTTWGKFHPQEINLKV